MFKGACERSNVEENTFVKLLSFETSRHSWMALKVFQPQNKSWKYLVPNENCTTMKLRPFQLLGVSGLNNNKKKRLRFLVQNYSLLNLNWLLTKLTGVTAVGQQTMYMQVTYSGQEFWRYSDFTWNLKINNDKYVASRYERVIKTKTHYSQTNSRL